MNAFVIDWIFGIIIVIFAISGLIKGFIDNVFGKIAFVAGVLLGYLFYKDIATGLLKDIKVPFAANVIAFLLIFVVVFLVIKIVQMIVARVFQWSILKSLDRTLGFIFGLVEGAVIVCLIIFLLTAQPFININPIFEDSFYVNIVFLIFKSTSEEIKTHV